jgi:hypothetical protein
MNDPGLVDIKAAFFLWKWHGFEWQPVEGNVAFGR